MLCDEIELKRQRIVYSISAAHLIREAESWNFLRTGEAEQAVTTTLADFAKGARYRAGTAGCPRRGHGTARLEPRAAAGGSEIGERPSRL